MFVPSRGLAGHNFFQDDSKLGMYEERAILFHSQENDNTIAEDPVYGKYLKNKNVMEEPTFGEQIIVEGCNNKQISVGDMFAVEGGLSDLVVQITSPRLACFHVDDCNQSSKGLAGMKRHSTTNCLAGWFTRVIKAGELRDGTRLVRTEHPHPKYTLAHLSTVLYSERDKNALMRCTAHWERSKSEHEELANLPELGRYKWKEKAEELLKSMNGEGKVRRSSGKAKR